MRTVFARFARRFCTSPSICATGPRRSSAARAGPSSPGWSACVRNSVSRKNEVRSLRDPMVRKGGLEPPRGVPPAPKAGASTNSATFAGRAASRAVARATNYSRSRRAGSARTAARRADGILIMLRFVDRAPRAHVAVDHYENFPVASRLVPARLRPAVVAIYRFARAADDLADEGDASASARLVGARGIRRRARRRSRAARRRPHRLSPSSRRAVRGTACRSRRCTTSSPRSART